MSQHEVIGGAAPRRGCLGLPLKVWLLVVGVWTLVGLFSAQQSYFAFALSGHPMAWSRLVVPDLWSVWLWVVFTPAIVWMARRFPVDRQTWPTAVPVHVGAGLALALLDVLFDTALLPWIDPTAPASIAQRYFRELFVNFWAYCAVVAVTLAAHYYALYRDRQGEAARLTSQLAVAHLDALKAQLQPHFLFNTLNAIAELVHEEPDRADRMIAHLGTLLRRAVETWREHEVPLRIEMEFVRAYLEIVETRLRGRLEVRYDVDPEVLAALVPTFALQPLVENAVRHGVEPAQLGGRIEIAARRRDGEVFIEISDNGPGLVAASDGDPVGVGIANTRGRLEQLYGPDRLAIRNRPTGGVDVSLRIPFHTVPIARAAPVG